MTRFVPPTVEPPAKVLGVWSSLRAVRRNVLSILPAISYTQPIVTGTTGPARWHMVQGPEAMRQVFLDNAHNYPKSEVMIRMLRPAIGSSLFTSEGADWRWQRRAIAPVFSARNVSTLAPLMTQTADRTARRLSDQPGPVEIVEQMLSATFDVICDVALSGREHFDVDTYSAAITRYFLTVGRASLLDFLEVPPWFPRPGELLGASAVRTMHRMVSRAIEARRAETCRDSDDLLDYMLDAHDPETGRRMDARDLLHNMQFFIVAGHETTALAISWGLYLLANDPDAQSRAATEARDLIGQRAATAEDLAALPLTKAALDEAMRLYPPVGLLARNVLAPDTLYGRDIGTGETVFLNIYALHRHQDYWDAPEMFDINRFSPEARKSRDKYLYLPFGAGPRVCVGANFAMMQAQIILATLLARFHFAPSGPAPEPVMHMTIRPEPGVTLAVTER
ncbi:cytochrome P450 [Qingshengfaniella alkalisoli]|uniref:Cytochrome P450 n=1 Tax=Qingshengfaniella alkalisoli TaxID=2599296 RepID=A0A5B8JAA7_9RHOB|nr:cytochrome P450 [Qingshengfaniella alkalisoli]QDY71237.1 cytochrome P450 [Qingshengfaniella alkalisoli]